MRPFQIAVSRQQSVFSLWSGVEVVQSRKANDSESYRNWLVADV
jgi:hypothetical protein